MACVFCDIAGGTLDACRVLENDEVIAFLDRSPLFPGHTLVIPRRHVVTLDQVEPALMATLMATVQRVMRAVVIATGAQGTFIANNNVVSQSVAHLHVHVVPRTKGDGLKGFFWPRHKYASDEAMTEMAAKVRDALV